jgi:hypothetical protein
VIVDFLHKHAILMALTASAAWFYGGRDYFRKGSMVGALFWGGIAVLILIAFCISVVFFAAGSGVSLAIAIISIAIEIWLMRRWMSNAVRQG